MDAYEISDFILSLIKKSNLNFSLSESPFSVSIDIKKTFIKNKDGSTRSSNIPENSSFSFNTQKVQPIVPIPPKVQNLPHQVSQPAPLHIQTQGGVLHHHQDTENNRHIGLILPPHHANNHPLHHVNELPHNKTHTIEPFLNKAHDEPPLPLQPAQLETPHQDLTFPRQQEHVPNIPVKNRFSCLGNISNELNNNAEQDEVDYLVVNNRRLKQVSKRLNTELARVKTEFKKDKNATVKDLKAEIKQWRKSLGLERSQKIKLEKKLVIIEASRTCSPRESSSATSIPTSILKYDSEEHEDEVALDLETCSICARPIPNYTPRYSSGLLWNPACSDCDDASEDDNDDTPG